MVRLLIFTAVLFCAIRITQTRKHKKHTDTAAQARSRITGHAVEKWVTAGGSGRARFVPDKKTSRVGPGGTLPAPGMTKRSKGHTGHSGEGGHGGRVVAGGTMRRDGMFEYRKIHSTNGSDVYENNPAEV